MPRRRGVEGAVARRDPNRRTTTPTRAELKKRRRPETVRIRSNPRARRETIASRVAREDAACAREPREASRHQKSPKWRRSRRRRRRRSGSTSCRSARRTSPTRRVARVEARVRGRERRARRSLRRASSRHGAGKRPQSRVVRPENRARVVAAAACVARLADSRTRRLEDSPNPNPPEPRNPRPIPNPELSLANASSAARRSAAVAKGASVAATAPALAAGRRSDGRSRFPNASVRIADVAARSPASARDAAATSSSSVAVAGPAPPEKRRAAGRRCASYARPNAREPRVMKAPHAGRMSPKSQPSVRAFEEDEDVAAANHASASPFASEGDASSSRRTSRVSEGFGVGFESFESSRSGVKMSPARRSASHAGSRNPPSPRGGTVRRTSNASSFARRSGGILDRASAPKSEPSDAGNASKSERSDAGNASTSEPSDAGSNPRRSDRDETVPSASAPARAARPSPRRMYSRKARGRRRRRRRRRIHRLCARNGASTRE